MKKIFFLSSILILAFSCGKTKEQADERYVILDSLIYDKYNIKIEDFSGVKNLFIINSNNGSCYDCVIDFSNYTKKYITDKKSLIIINSKTEENLDNVFFKEKHSNVIIYKDEVKWNRLNPLSMITYVRLNDRKIDTLLYISPPIDNTVKYIDSLNLSK